MPKLVESNPKYRLHKQSGRGRVRVDGRDVLLPGKFESRESRDAYNKFVGEWIVNGRRLPPHPDQPVTVEEVAADYILDAEKRYFKDGRTTSEYDLIRAALRHVRRLYGETAAGEFGPRKLCAVQESMVTTTGWQRNSINRHISRIRRMFKWAAAKELIPATVYQTLQTFEGLRRGKTEAPESEGVKPVTETTVDRTLPLLPHVVADMVRFQQLTGARPGEVCDLTPDQVDCTGEEWEYRVTHHKTEHHGKERTIPIGPKAQVILQPYLGRNGNNYCFSPSESEKRRLDERNENRRTPLSCGNRPGTNKKSRRKRSPGDYYTVSSYRKAIHRACDKAYPPPAPLARRDDETRTQWEKRLTAEDWESLEAWRSEHRWSPNQLRHTAGTKIRKEFGLEAAGAVLGHANLRVTEIYAERNAELAKRVAQQIG